MTQIHCKHTSRNGVSCSRLADGHSGFCFWHDAQAPKNTHDIKNRLEKLLDDGESLEGFALHRAQLRDANLAHANLMNARLFQADLAGASLFKANLDGANLNLANLEDVNLLGTRLDNARLEHTKWGKILFQQRLAAEAENEGDKEKAIQLYGEAEEVARYLTNESEKRHQYDIGGKFFRLERVMHRMQMRRFSAEWCWSKLLDVMCGYGESAARVIGFSLAETVLSAIVYFLLGVKGPEGIIMFNANNGLETNVLGFLECLYFSIITFTTTGYGDVLPIGITRVFAAAEAFIGAFAISLFVVVFVRKMTQ
ncbi:MAG: pentapeptide repeat-containing protein [Methylococcales bacterium]|nr:pentapeptide repeat-containing protein [Methylococcales bacterium]